jgi:hypothetical protein
VAVLVQHCFYVVSVYWQHCFNIFLFDVLLADDPTKAWHFNDKEGCPLGSPLFVTAILAAFQGQRSKTANVLLYAGEVAFALHAVETPLKDAGTRLLKDAGYNRTAFELQREKVKTMLALHPRFYSAKKQGYCFGGPITIASELVEKMGLPGPST